jgi:PAS domain S-box-containing protein
MPDLDFLRLFEALPSPHMLIDREHRFVAVNAAYEAVTLRTRDELIGRNLFDLFPNDGDGGRRLKASFERVFETGRTDTIAYIPYDIPRPEALGGGMDLRYWTAVHVPVTDADGRVAFLMQNTVDVTEAARLREAASLPFRSRPAETALIERAREAERAHAALMADSDDFRRLFSQAPGFIAVLSGPDHVFTFANEAYRRLIGGRNVVGMSVRDALPEIDGQGFLELLDAVYADGVQRGGEGARVLLRQAADQEPREAFLDFSYGAIRGEDGAITGIFVQGMDRTETFKAQRRQRLLLDELNHRVKNTLSSVQSIAAQTFRQTRDPAAARDSFEARLLALSKTHDLLSERNWTDADLRSVIEQEFAAFDTVRRAVHGPQIRLNAKSAIAIAMVLHELVTNAVRFGALSVAAGSVSVTWSVMERGGASSLELRWREEGGPRIDAPVHSGFGARMIARAVRGELGGEYACDYPPKGFSCAILLPLDTVTRDVNEFA